MRILITAIYLDRRSGSELHVRDLAMGLQKRGHVPVVYTPRPGMVSREIAAAGIQVVNRLRSLGKPPDLIHANHYPEAFRAFMAFPGVPGLWTCHSMLSEAARPPIFPRCLRYVAVDHTCRDRLLGEGIPDGLIPVIYNGVDVRRFRPRPPLPERPSRALLFSSYAKPGPELDAIRSACDRRNLPLEILGAGIGALCERPELELGKYDLVFARSRAALEAMAVGAAVILTTTHGFGPMVTSGELESLRHDNFGMRHMFEPLDPDRIAAEISRYNAEDARTLSMRIRETAHLDVMIDGYLAVYREVLDEHARTPRAGRKEERRAASLRHRYRREAWWRETTLRFARFRQGVARLPLIGPALRKVWRMFKVRLQS